MAVKRCCKKGKGTKIDIAKQLANVELIFTKF